MTIDLISFNTFLDTFVQYINISMNLLLQINIHFQQTPYSMVPGFEHLMVYEHFCLLQRWE